MTEEMIDLFKMRKIAFHIASAMDLRSAVEILAKAEIFFMGKPNQYLPDWDDGFLVYTDDVLKEGRNSPYVQCLISAWGMEIVEYWDTANHYRIRLPKEVAS